MNIINSRGGVGTPPIHTPAYGPAVLEVTTTFSYLTSKGIIFVEDAVQQICLLQEKEGGM